MSDSLTEQPMIVEARPAQGPVLAAPEPCAPAVVGVAVVNDTLLEVQLANGRAGLLDISWLLGWPAFARLKDAGYFRRVGIAFGTVSWPDGEDISPESVAARLV